MLSYIVIAGGGVSGLFAALSAAQNGAEVVLIEKMSYLGGTFFLSGGSLATVGSEVVEGFDDRDRTLAFFKKINETSSRQPDYDFIAKMLPETGKVVDWLVKDFGFDFATTDFGDYVRTNFGSKDDRSGAALTKQLEGLLNKFGVKILLNTKAESIITDNGKAVGLLVSNESGKFKIHAEKVIIAVGGASRNWELMTKVNPVLKNIDYVEAAAVSSTGDGFKMLEDAGAKMDVGPYIKSSYPEYSPVLGYTFRTAPTQQNQIVVNSEGKRVANESPYNQMYFNSQLYCNASKAYYVIFESEMLPDKFRNDADKFTDRNDNTIVVKADNLKDLAKKMEVDYSALRETLDRYNKMCADGKDSDFGKDSKRLIAYKEKSPLYAFRVYVSAYGTIGGAVTDDTFHVINNDGKVIENLFAIGECSTGRFFGDYYLGAFSVGFYSASGRIAGETAVKEFKAGK